MIKVRDGAEQGAAHPGQLRFATVRIVEEVPVERRADDISLHQRSGPDPADCQRRARALRVFPMRRTQLLRSVFASVKGGTAYLGACGKTVDRHGGQLVEAAPTFDDEAGHVVSQRKLIAVQLGL